MWLSYSHRGVINTYLMNSDLCVIAIIVKYKTLQWCFFRHDLSGRDEQIITIKLSGRRWILDLSHVLEDTDKTLIDVTIFFINNIWNKTKKGMRFGSV